MWRAGIEEGSGRGKRQEQGESNVWIARDTPLCMSGTVVNANGGRDGTGKAECWAEQGCFGEGRPRLGSHSSLALALLKASREAQLQLTMMAADCVGYVP